MMAGRGCSAPPEKRAPRSAGQFDNLVSSVVRLNLDEKRGVWEMLNEQLAQAEEERWERDPALQQELGEARAAYVAGEYMTIEEYVAHANGDAE